MDSFVPGAMVEDGDNCRAIGMRQEEVFEGVYLTKQAVRTERFIDNYASVRSYPIGPWLHPK